MFVYDRMLSVLCAVQNHHLPEKWVYQAALTPFLSFYAIFAFVLFPNAAKLHPTHLLASLQAWLPSGKADSTTAIGYGQLRVDTATQESTFHAHHFLRIFVLLL